MIEKMNGEILLGTDAKFGLRALPLQRSLGKAPVSVFRVGGLLDELSLEPHRHDFHMLYWTVAGTGEHMINFRNFEMTRGRLFLVMAGQAHQVRAYAGDGWLVLFDKVLLDTFLVEHLLEAQTGLFDLFTAVPFVDMPSELLLRMEKLAMLLQQEIENGYDAPLARNYVQMLLLYAGRQYRARGDLKVSAPYADMIRKLKVLIEQNYKKERLAAFYAGRLGIPVRKLNEVTMGAMGKIVMEIITDRLLAESEAMLAVSGLMVKEIAAELGFIDQAHFAYFFRQHKKVSPRDFRKQLEGYGEKTLPLCPADISPH
jgi:AraC-like DNA-binding protein/mannose-6-phosphate isomerase-like protein (cupin superfamily)